MYSLKPKLSPETLMLKPRFVLKDMRILNKGLFQSRIREGILQKVYSRGQLVFNKLAYQMSDS